MGRSNKMIKKLMISSILFSAIILSEHIKADENNRNTTSAIFNDRIESSLFIDQNNQKDNDSVPSIEIPKTEKTEVNQFLETYKEEYITHNLDDNITSNLVDDSSRKITEDTVSNVDKLESSSNIFIPANKDPEKDSDIEAKHPETNEVQEVFMDSVNSFQIKLDSKETVKWSIEGLPEKQYNIETGQFDADNVLKISISEIDGQKQYDFQINPLFGEDLSLRSPHNIRRLYRDYMKEYILRGVNDKGNIVLDKKLFLRPYKNFKTHDELQQTINLIRDNHISDRLVKIETIGISQQNRPIRMGIVAKNQEVIDHYLNTTTPEMLTNPDESLELLKQGKFQYMIPILINNTHADEQPGIDIILSLFNEFAKKDEIVYKTVDENNNPKQVILNVKNLLDKIIFLFDFTENPDGNVLNTRALANGMDPNRDTGYQTNPETRSIVEQITKWNPIAIFDIHGFIKEFLIEPATPPHDPNFEYDIFENNLLEEAKEMGRSGITNSKYTKFIIPKIDYGSGWDDSFSGYTAVYGLYHGILGHTIEIPESNQDSFYAGFYAVLAGINYDFKNSQELMLKRLRFYSRGVNQIEEKSAETPLVSVDGTIKGRIKHGNPKFFPNYYVIPLEVSSHNDVEQAYKMIDYFRRNGVIVNQLKEDYAGYKKGDVVIDMAQAKRGYANHVLYKGSDESEWPEMYAEVVNNFPDMRGFKSVPIFKKNLFNNKLEHVTLTASPRTKELENINYYFISNNSLSSIQAVNDALKGKKSVYLTDDGYVVSSSTFKYLIQKYPLYAEPFSKKPVGESMKLLKIFAPGNPNKSLGFSSVSEVSLALNEMGFEVVDNLDDSDVLILDNNQFKENILGKKPTIIIGGSAMKRLEKLKVLDGFVASRTDDGTGESYEGLLNIELDDSSPYTSGYSSDSLYYTNSGSWIESIPLNFRKLASVKNNNFYISGWWPGHESLAGKTVAISGEYKGNPMIIIAGNPVNKKHTINFYRWVSNAIFGTKLSQFVDDQALTDSTELKVHHISYNTEFIPFHDKYIGHKMLNKSISISNLTESRYNTLGDKDVNKITSASKVINGVNTISYISGDRQVSKDTSEKIVIDRINYYGAKLPNTGESELLFSILGYLSLTIAFCIDIRNKEKY